MASPGDEQLRLETPGAVFTIAAKAWDSAFFGRPISSFSVERSAPVDPAALAATLHLACEAADEVGAGLLECHLDSRDFVLAAALEEVGFRLVDSRAEFLSRMTMADVPASKVSRGSIAVAESAQTDRLLELIHLGFTDNDRFVSRFKNPEYFTPTESRRYFEAWLKNTAFKPESETAIFVVDDRIVGFYIYLRQGSYQDLPVLKGILTAVEPEHRGANAQLAMQAFLYPRFGIEAWYLDNTTQITNVPVIRNHIRSNKWLEKVVLTFYRKPGGSVGI